MSAAGSVAVHHFQFVYDASLGLVAHRALESSCPYPRWLLEDHTDASGDDCGASDDASDEKPSRKRRRHVVKKDDPVRAQRAEEALARHDILVRALTGVRGEAGATSRDAEGPALPVPDPGRDPPFNWLVVAAMRAVTKPRLQWIHACRDTASGAADEDGGRLFDTMQVHSADDADALVDAAGEPVVMPPMSAFVMPSASDRVACKGLLRDSATQSGGFRLIVADPPWENASAHRGGKYPTLPSAHLLGLPMADLLAQDGGVLCLWLPNRERHWRFALGPLLHAWGLTPLATWLWLKTRHNGAPIFPLDSAHRKPYEPLLVLVNAAAAARLGLPGREGGAAGDDARDKAHAMPHVAGVLVGTPAQHSRKPYLGVVMADVVSRAAGLEERVADASHLSTASSDGCMQFRCLEMFARSLRRGWLSFGCEVLAFQSHAHFSCQCPACPPPSQRNPA